VRPPGHTASTFHRQETTVDTTATTHTNANPNGGDADESGQWALREALTSAWHTAQPWIDLPPAWLDAAATALASPPPADCTDNRPEHEHTDGPQLVACQQRTVAELRRLRGETRAQTNAAARRRQELASLQSLVRERALATLSDNPRLEGPLPRRCPTGAYHPSPPTSPSR